MYLLEHRAAALDNLYIFTGTQAIPENIRKLHPNLIVNATGFGPLLPPINGLMDNIDKEGGNVYSILGMISHINDFPQDLEGKKIAVIGGGAVGLDVVEFFAARKADISIVEMMDQIAKEESNTILPTLMRELEHYNVQIVTSAKLSEIKDDSVVVEKTIDDNTSTEEIASDFVVMAVGARKNLPELSDCPLPLHYIGDCAGERPSNIDHAIKSAYDVACEI